MRGVDVHIVLPRRELFTREPMEATASVVIKMQGANRLDRSQTSAIQQLISTAVPNLDPNRITIVDDRGTLLHGGGDQDDGTLNPDNVADMRSGFEGRLSGKVTEMLERVVGVGKARVEVSAEMDFSQETSSIQSYDPEQQVLVSSREIEDTSSSQEANQDTVTVGNNLPDAGALDGGAVGNTETSARTVVVGGSALAETRRPPDQVVLLGGWKIGTPTRSASRLRLGT